MCGYRGKRRARSLTGGIDSLLDVRGESVVSLPSLSSGDLQGDELEGASSPEVWLHTAAVMCASRFVAAGLPSPFTCVVTAVVRHAMTSSLCPTGPVSSAPQVLFDGVGSYGDALKTQSSLCVLWRYGFRAPWRRAS